MIPWIGRARDGPAADCEAFLAGTYLELLVDRNLPIPTWAWLNVLAHGTMARLVDVARDIELPGDPRPRWSAARAFLAGEVVDLVVDDQARLGALQSAVLWPWELDVAARCDAFVWAPSDLVLLTVGALHGRVAVRP